MNLFVDINADLGEGAGHDDELFELISSANIATGFHAGDSDTMHAAVFAAKEHGVAVGAHPSFFDRENFGRKELNVADQEVLDAVAYQLGIFQAIASALDVRPNHVKPHGALYNMAVRDAKLADAIARAIESVDSKLILFAPDKSELARAGEAHGLQIAPEIFADRNYLNDGWLVPRTRSDALLHDPKEAAAARPADVARRQSALRRRRAMWMCAAKRFAFMAIHRVQLGSRVNCEHNSNVKASE